MSWKRTIGGSADFTLGRNQISFNNELAATHFTTSQLRGLDTGRSRLGELYRRLFPLHEAWLGKMSQRIARFDFTVDNDHDTLSCWPNPPRPLRSLGDQMSATSCQTTKFERTRVTLRPPRGEWKGTRTQCSFFTIPPFVPVLTFCAGKRAQVDDGIRWSR